MVFTICCKFGKIINNMNEFRSIAIKKEEQIVLIIRNGPHLQWKRRPFLLSL